MRSLSDEERRAIVATASQLPAGLETIEQGAATSLWCATSSALDGKGGVYCEDVDIAEAVPADFPEARGVRPWASDPALAERLWQQSEAWTGVRFDA
jgi:hypothetical protein